MNKIHKILDQFESMGNNKAFSDFGTIPALS